MVANDFAWLFDAYPAIERVGFNGPLPRRSSN